MPIEKKKVKGKTWYRWGKSGAWYDNLQDALRQGKAIKISEARRRKK